MMLRREGSYLIHKITKLSHNKVKNPYYYILRAVKS